METDEPLRRPPRRPRRSVRSVVAFGLFVVAAIVALFALAMRRKNADTMNALHADMINLATAQIAYYTDHTAYGADAAAFYRPQHRSNVRVVSASDTSWSATATHPHTSKVAWRSFECR